MVLKLIFNPVNQVQDYKKADKILNIYIYILKIKSALKEKISFHYICIYLCYLQDVPTILKSHQHGLIFFFGFFFLLFHIFFSILFSYLFLLTTHHECVKKGLKAWLLVFWPTGHPCQVQAVANYIVKEKSPLP